MFENSSLPREMRVSPWESSGQRAFANSLAGTVLHTPNSTVTHACVVSTWMRCGCCFLGWAEACARAGVQVQARG